MRIAINILCAIYNNKLIGPVFYNGTLTGARYLKLLQNVIPDLWRTCRCLMFGIHGLNITQHQLTKKFVFVVSKIGLQVRLIWVYWTISCGDNWKSWCVRHLRKHCRTINDATLFGCWRQSFTYYAPTCATWNPNKHPNVHCRERREVWT